jgi:hypothetical protein
LCSKSSHGSWVIFGDINSILFLESSGTPLDNFVIKIFSSQMGISGGGFDFKDSVINSKERYIKSTTTKIEN